MSRVAGRAADASPDPLPGMVTPPSGLPDKEVSRRIAAGQTNATDVRTSRSITEIVRANVFTVFNALLAALFVVTMATERWQNGLFGVVIVVNAGIGIVQEWRAKQILDRLALLNAPHARVVRNGTLLNVDVAAVVLDDLLEVRAGDQVPADGLVRQSAGLEVDESLLTGESEPVAKRPVTRCGRARSWSPAKAASRPPPSVRTPTRHA